MSWKAVNTVSLRLEFVELAVKEDSNISELCRRFGVSRKTGYKWIKRYKEKGSQGLADRSRRPKSSPTTSPEKVVSEALKIRDKHPAWGARKIHKRLQVLEVEDVPAVSTINGILKRNGCISEEASKRSRTFTRFEHPEPNDLWQMDFKGHFPMTNGRRCHPLTILDDHSRYSIALRAMDTEKRIPVQNELTNVFRRFGLPAAMLMDNGPPWGTSQKGGHTQLEIWLMMLGIRVIHSRPRHPQTNGKDERFHLTLKVEVLQGETFADLKATQSRFDPFRKCYNHERPHESLALDVPASRYKPSPRSFPEKIPDWDYGDAMTRRVGSSNCITFRKHRFKIGKGFRGQDVAIRPTSEEDAFHVYFRNSYVKTINLDQSPEHSG